jgi:hypothetical protein
MQAAKIYRLSGTWGLNIVEHGVFGIFDHQGMPP